MKYMVSLLTVLLCLVGSTAAQDVPAFFYPTDGAYVNAVGDSLIFYERTDGTDSVVAIFSQNGIYFRVHVSDSMLMTMHGIESLIEDSLNEYSLTSAIAAAYLALADTATYTADIRVVSDSAKAVDTSYAPLVQLVADEIPAQGDSVYWDDVADQVAADSNKWRVPEAAALTNLTTNDPLYKASAGVVACSTATATLRGVAKFNTDNFGVASGDVTIKSGGVNSDEILNQTIVKADIDTTSSFVVGSAYKASSATASNELATEGYADSAAASGSVDSAIIDIGGGTYKSSSAKAWSLKAGSGLEFTTATDSSGIDTMTIMIDDSLTFDNLDIYSDLQIGGNLKQVNFRHDLDISVAWAEAADDYLDIRIPEDYIDGDSADRYYSMHPGVVYVPDGFLGYRYWMAMTPLDAEGHENPCIRVSNNGDDWELFVGPTPATDSCPDPLWIPGDCDEGAFVTDHCSDATLVFGEEGKLWCVFRATDASWNKLFVTGTSDGFTWSGPTEIIDGGNWHGFEDKGDLYSPAIDLDSNGTYVMWFVEGMGNAENKVHWARSGDIESGWPSAVNNANAGECTWVPGGDSTESDIWHIEVRTYGVDNYFALVTQCGEDQSGTSADLWIATSTDGETWTARDTVVMHKTDNSWASNSLYRASGFWVLDGSGLYFDLFYSARATGTPAPWYTGRGKIYFGRSPATYKFAYLRTVHGFGRALSDSIYLNFPTQSLNGDTAWLLVNYAGDITAGDQDTVNISGDVPANATIDKVQMRYRVKSGSEIDTVSLRGHDVSGGDTDSTYWGHGTDLTSTTMAGKEWTLTNNIKVNSDQNEFTFRYIVNFDNDYDSLWIDWVRLRYWE